MHSFSLDEIQPFFPQLTDRCYQSFFEPLANTAVAWMYCCISQFWISDALQLFLFCSPPFERAISSTLSVDSFLALISHQCVFFLQQT